MALSAFSQLIWLIGVWLMHFWLIHLWLIQLWLMHGDSRQVLLFDRQRRLCRISLAVLSWKAARNRRIRVTCRSGGIGRRAWFRSMCPQGRGGSSPFFGTRHTTKSLIPKYCSKQIWSFEFHVRHPRSVSTFNKPFMILYKSCGDKSN